MTKKELILNLNLFADATYKHQVLCNIYHATDYTKDKRNVIASLRSPNYIALDPGDYTIEVILPSGKILSNTTAIATDLQEPKELTIQFDETPHEWLANQLYFSNVDKNEYELFQKEAETSFRYERFELIPINLVSIISFPYLHLFKSKLTNKEFSLISLMSKGFFFLTPSKELIRKQLDPNLSFYYPLSRSTEIDSVSELYKFRSLSDIGGYDQFHENIINKYHQREANDIPEENLKAISLSFENDSELQFVTRQYLFFRGSTPQYCVLPIPWISPSMNSVEVEILYYYLIPGTIEPDQQLSILVKDEVFSTVLGYLQSGNSQAAAKIVQEEENMRTAYDLLVGKRRNPLAAAGGAYALLSNYPMSVDLFQRWPDWVKNLKNWYLWLPDGAIQHAWMLLLSEPLTENTKQKIREDLLDGYRRGLPFYSKGVKMLLDGLRMLANEVKRQNEPDSEVEKALDVVWNLSSRINPNQPFTTVLRN